MPKFRIYNVENSELYATIDAENGTHAIRKLHRTFYCGEEIAENYAENYSFLRFVAIPELMRKNAKKLNPKN